MRGKATSGRRQVADRYIAVEALGGGRGGGGVQQAGGTAGKGGEVLQVGEERRTGKRTTVHGKEEEDEEEAEFGESTGGVRRGYVEQQRLPRQEEEGNAPLSGSSERKQDEREKVTEDRYKHFVGSPSFRRLGAKKFMVHGAFDLIARLPSEREHQSQVLIFSVRVARSFLRTVVCLRLLSYPKDLCLILSTSTCSPVERLLLRSYCCSCCCWYFSCVHSSHVPTLSRCCVFRIVATAAKRRPPTGLEK